MAYENRCGSCDNFEDAKVKKPYDKSNPDYVKGFCNWYRTFYYPDDFCENHFRPRGYQKNCYITTILCDRLGYDDQCDTLNTLREFRNCYLQKDEKYAPILYEYDIVGPKIAEELEMEDIEIIQGLYDGFIMPIVSEIKSKNYQEAVHDYITMTKCLEETYGIDSILEVPKNYDYKNGGHGRVKTYRLDI